MCQHSNLIILESNLAVALSAASVHCAMGRLSGTGLPVSSVDIKYMSLPIFHVPLLVLNWN